jgi:hypothetical protein
MRNGASNGLRAQGNFAKRHQRCGSGGVSDGRGKFGFHRTGIDTGYVQFEGRQEFM